MTEKNSYSDRKVECPECNAGAHVRTYSCGCQHVSLNVAADGHFADCSSRDSWSARFEKRCKNAVCTVRSERYEIKKAEREIGRMIADREREKREQEKSRSGIIKEDCREVIATLPDNTKQTFKQLLGDSPIKARVVDGNIVIEKGAAVTILPPGSKIKTWG